jgi:hypothetical protein
MYATGGGELDGTGAGSEGRPVAEVGPGENACGPDAALRFASALTEPAVTPAMPLLVPTVAFGAAADDPADEEPDVALDSSWLEASWEEDGGDEEQDEGLFVPAAGASPDTDVGAADAADPQAAAGMEPDAEDGLAGESDPPLGEPADDAVGVPGCPAGAGLEVAEPTVIAPVDGAEPAAVPLEAEPEEAPLAAADP